MFDGGMVDLGVGVQGDMGRQNNDFGRHSGRGGREAKGQNGMDFGVESAGGAAVGAGARLAQEPRRLWKRYLVTNTQFIFHILKSSVSSESKPR